MVALRITTEYEYTDIVEVKNGGLLSGSRTSSTPHALAQIFASLHFLATAAILKSLTQNILLNNVVCRGLLINWKEMILCTLEARISVLESSEFILSFNNIAMDEVHMSVLALLNC